MIGAKIRVRKQLDVLRSVLALSRHRDNFAFGEDIKNPANQLGFFIGVNQSILQFDFADLGGEVEYLVERSCFCLITLGVLGIVHAALKSAPNLQKKIVLPPKHL